MVAPPRDGITELTDASTQCGGAYATRLVEATRLPSEERLRRALLSHPAVSRLPDDPAPLVDERFQLMQSCLVVDAGRVSDLRSRLERALSELGIDIAVEIHILPQPGYNAFTLACSLDEAIVLAVSSHLLEDFSADELMFVIGHELGHHLLGHTNRVLARLAQAPKDSVLFLRGRSLSRHQELSSDRLGLLCCGSFETAVSSLIKLMIQSTGSRLQVGAEDLLRQAEEQLFHFHDAAIDGYTPWNLTHPSLPIRARALQPFAELAPVLLGTLRSETSTPASALPAPLPGFWFQELAASPGRGHRTPDPEPRWTDEPDHRYSDLGQRLAEVNRGCEELLDTMELDRLKEDRSLVVRFYESVLRLGIEVARADELRRPPEQQVLSLLERKVGWGHGQEHPAPPLPNRDEALSFLKRHASRGRRLRIVELLLSIAIQDLDLDPREDTVLVELTSALEVPHQVYRRQRDRIVDRLRRSDL